MTDQSPFTAETISFLNDLRANNTRDWFQDNKKRYERDVKGPTKFFAMNMCGALEKLTGQAHASRTYRINRDLRFSKDKTPYNTHIHLSFQPDGTGPNAPMWFFGLDPESFTLGCGVFQFDKAGLSAFRARVAGPDGKDLMKIATEMTAKGVRIRDPELQRVPSGFDKDHPRSELLRRKGFAVWRDMESPELATDPGLTERTIAELERFLPLFQFLSGRA